MVVKSFVVVVVKSFVVVVVVVVAVAADHATQQSNRNAAQLQSIAGSLVSSSVNTTNLTSDKFSLRSLAQAGR